MPNLDRLTDDELLGMRFCDLRLSVDDGVLADRLATLEADLENRGLRFRPHYWLSTEWFSPDGVPGIAIPFYLAHPRLVRLERKQMLEAEGSSAAECVKILRHEAGHAIDTAYRLRRKRRYRQVFGSASQPYPDSYLPQPSSRDYVRHLNMYYAQAHPLEDFAETFAVWLRPGSRWRSRYREWPAIEKLQLVDDLMREIRDEVPPVRSRRCVDPLTRNRTTLGEHYAAKREQYGLDYPSVLDPDLRRLFPGDSADRSARPAAKFLQSIRAELRESVARWTGEYSYTIDQVIAEMIQRCRELKLRLGDDEERARRDAAVLVAIRTAQFIQEGRHRIAM